MVGRATTSDSRGGEYVTEYRYWDGYYDGVEKEFRGFGYVEVSELGDSTAPTRVTRHWFDVGDTEESLKGKPKLRTIPSGDLLCLLRRLEAKLRWEPAFGASCLASQSQEVPRRR